MINSNFTEKFTQQELSRYARHFVLPSFGVEGQARLKAGRVLVVGAGGLGSPVLLYLAAAGVGHIGIIDPDVVDESNLQRQVLYTVEDLSKPKAEAAKQRLLALNPHITITTYSFALSKDNALDIIGNFDIVADGTDNFPTRYLVNDACVLTGKVNVYASIFRYEGQVSVFNYSQTNERGVQYRDLFPMPPPPDMIPNCAEGGVLGVLPGIIGSMQANEVIKILSGVGEPLAGRLFIFDAASFTTRVLKIPKNPQLVVPDALIDYDIFCQTPAFRFNTIKEISVFDLKNKIDNKEDFQLIDVREPFEYEMINLGGTLIPLSYLAENKDLIALDKPVIVHCKTGGRSAKAVEQLTTWGFNNVYNLTGGIVEYADKILK